MTRLLRPSDIASAATWYLGIDVVGDTALTRRIVRARVTYWAALMESGLSSIEVGHLVYRDSSTIRSLIKRHAPDPADVEAILARAAEQVAAECAKARQGTLL